MRRLARSIRAALAVAVVLAAAATLRAADGGGVLDGRVRLTLSGALRFESHRQTRDPWADTQDLTLDLVCRDGTWDAVAWGFTPYVPGQEHLGRVTQAEPAPNGRAAFHVELAVSHSRHDPCILGGTLRLAVELTREGDQLRGTFRGRSDGADAPDLRRRLEDAWGFGEVPGKRDWQQPTLANRLRAALRTADVSGRVRGTVRPYPPRPDGLAPAAPGEHPRLFFRKADLPALRERAATPEGRRILADLEAMLERAEVHGYGYRYPQAEHSMGPVWACGWGLLYQLTGDRTYAEKAGRHFYGNMYNSYYYGGGWIHAYTLMGMGAAYDLCAEAWAPDLRGLVYGYLERNVRDLAHRHDGADPLGVLERFRFANGQHDFRVRGPDDAYAATFRAGAAIAALALAGDKPPVYRPTPLEVVRMLEPAEGYDPWVGVPVVHLEDDIMFREWLVNGPFVRGTQDAALEPLGGFAGLRPEPGTPVEVEGVLLRFRRYLPTGAEDPNGPMIYARNCARYWTGATGGGYWPGIELARRWRERLGRRPPINVVLYTVLENETERIVQALPNWRSRNVGCRMWIAGREVRDGDLVRLRPGLYPVAVDVPVMGGYSAQAPKLREYTPAMYQADTARAAAAAQAYAGTGVHDNELRRAASALVRSVERYLDLAVGDHGWGGWDTHDTVLPMLLAVRNVLGEDLAAGTGLEELVPLAARMRGHMGDRTFDTMVSQGAAFVPARHRGLARWYLDTYGPGLARPLDALVALKTHPFDAAPVPPDGRYPLAAAHERHGVHAFAGGWGGADAPFALVETGREAPGNSVYAAGNLRLQAFGRFWAKPYWDGRHPDQGYAELNNASVRRLHPVAPARVMHADLRPDGSGAVTVVMDAFREVVAETHKGVVLAKADAGVTVQRAFAADTTARAGAPAVYVTVDTFRGTGRREKVWRMNLGEVYTTTAYNRRRPTLEVGDREVTVRPPKTDATMRITFLAPREGLELRTRSPRVKHPRGTVLEAKVDRHVSERERVHEARFEENAEAVERAVEEREGPGGPPVADEASLSVEAEEDPAPDRAAPDPVEDLLKAPGDPALESLLDAFDTEADRARRERERTLPPVTIITVLTIQEGDPPPVSLTGPEGDQTIRVGDRAFRYDGTKLTFDD